MFDRHLLGDIGLAILLAVPTVALSRPQAPIQKAEAAAPTMVQQAALADQSATDRRFNLEG